MTRPNLTKVPNVPVECVNCCSEETQRTAPNEYICKVCSGEFEIGPYHDAYVSPEPIVIKTTLRELKREAADEKQSPMKHDGDKIRVELVAPEYIEGTARVLTFGAKKYSAGNWADGSFKASRLVGACLRHLFAWVRGERRDPESGESHLYHASCCLMFLAVQEERGLLEDDMSEVGARKK